MGTDDEWCATVGKLNMESISQTIDEGLEAKNKLVTSNFRLVQGVVNVYIKNGLGSQYNAGDLMQEGILGLIRAAEKFDPGKGFRFSTYAMYWIRAGIKRDQLLQSRVVPIPQRLHENYKKIIKAEKKLKNSLDRPPTNSELSNAVNLSEALIERCKDAVAQKFFSLDQTMVNQKKYSSGENSETMHSIIEKKTDDNDLDLVRLFLREDLMKALKSNLSEEQAYMIMLRFGMDTEPATSKHGGLRTINEICSLVGLKPDKVRRIIKNSLKQLHEMVGKDFEFYYSELNS